jgi:hypothetical protein
MRFTNEARDPDSGVVVYSNRGVIFARAAWGKITYQEDYEDTQRVVEFDEYLAARGLLPHEPMAGKTKRPRRQTA